MLLTPAAVPPAPGSISELSDVAVKILAFLNKEAEEELIDLANRPSLVDKLSFTKIKSDVFMASENILGERKPDVYAAQAPELGAQEQIVSEYFPQNDALVELASGSRREVPPKTKGDYYTKESYVSPLQEYSTTGRWVDPLESSIPVGNADVSDNLDASVQSPSLTSRLKECKSLYFRNESSCKKQDGRQRIQGAISFGRLKLNNPKQASPRHQGKPEKNVEGRETNKNDSKERAILVSSPRKQSQHAEKVNFTPGKHGLVLPPARPSKTLALSPRSLPCSSTASSVSDPRPKLCTSEKLSEPLQELTENFIQNTLLVNIVEICFTISYEEGFCLLNTPINGTKAPCTPNGILMKITKSDKSELPIYAFLREPKLKETTFKEYLLSLLNITCRKVCYDSQAFIIYVIDKAGLQDKKVSYDWLLIDPMLGFWMIDPDRPPMTFKNLMTSLCGISDALSDSNVFCRLLDGLSRVFEALYSKLNRLNLWNIFYNLETKITPIIAVMECSSIIVDYAQLDMLSILLNERMKSLDKLALQLSGGIHFNLNSNVQLSHVLYDNLKLDVKAGISVSTTGQAKVKSTAESTLKLLEKHHKLPKIIMEYRKLQKIRSVFVDGIASRVINKKYISTTWEQCAAATGRLVSKSPNLQAIPKSQVSFEGSDSLNLRKPYLPRKGFIFVAADFEQIELRIIAHLSEDSRLVEAFKQSDDVFASITRMRLAKAEISPAERSQTKTLVYALVYGAGVNRIAEISGLEKTAAVNTCERLYTLFPRMKKFRQKVIQDCQRNKYLTSLGGRRRMFLQIEDPDSNIRNRTERQAVNFIIQGSAADICKAAMVRTEYALRKQGVNSRLLLQIHDELLWEVPVDDVENTKGLIKDTIEAKSTDFFRKLSLNVPLPVKITSGPNWGEMKD